MFAFHKGRYGYRRVTVAIRQLGQNVNHKTVQRLMVEMGLKSLVRPKKYRSYKGDAGRAAPDLLRRQFAADAANQKWGDCQEFCAVGRFHQLKNRSPKMTANCVFASTHS
ncbi:IS3 family transposase, partial [Sinorhizobium meliloti]|uniref:IS3 family transposase n=1 Tax=Rhizobium meliloti TaxID=382 RepID=UPI001F377170